ncbi:MAG: ATP-binding protein [Solirubrobacterales bacterium]
MSIRLRLLIGVLVLTAGGLAATALVSHAALRSYLSDRLDQQVTSAEEPVARSLIASAIESGEAKPFGTLPNGGKLRPPSDPRQDAQAGLPPGTYGELRDKGGKLLASKQFSYGEKNLPTVELPADVTVSAPGSAKVVSASSASGSDGFRVAAFALPRDGGTIVVALPEREMNQTLSRLATIELIVSGAVLLAAALLTLWVVKLGLSPLERMQRAARAIVAGDLGKRVEPASERTEVGRLGIALNEMLRRIQDAFAKRQASEERMRRFLADASHELRTPLSSMRGYAELFRLGMADDPEELAKAMGRIEAESKRMGELIADLLTLARLDRVREPADEPVELVAVVREACDAARAIAPERTITLDGDERAMVIGDRGQLRRAVENLLSNALRHTPGSTPVAVTVDRSGRNLRVRVRDYGRGLAPGSEQAVFERFWRGDAARGRADGGAGLGLAIVAAIASRHEGTCSASSPSGGGALFEISVPVDRAPSSSVPDGRGASSQPVLRRS